MLQLELDAFANAMVAIENLLPAGGGVGGGGGEPMPPPETFYFKIPPNTQLLNVWQTIDDRLYKLRHCLSLTGQPLALPPFDAPLDPGLLAAAEAAGVDLYQITDPRYLQFEGAGAISDWHLELPPNNQIDVAAVSDVLLHVLYTALDGGPDFGSKAAAWAATQPQFATKLFSAANDFSAPSPTVASPYPVMPWQALLATPSGGVDQVLTLSINSTKFPIWTRGKKITVTGMNVYAVSWTGGSFQLQPQAPLPTANVAVNSPGLPNLLANGTVALPAGGVSPATWSFKLQVWGARNFQSLTSSQIADLILELQFTAT